MSKIMEKYGKMFGLDGSMMVYTACKQCGEYFFTVKNSMEYLTNTCSGCTE